MALTTYTKEDHNGYLRSYVEFNCRECGKLTTQRKDEFNRRGKLCRECKFSIYHKNKANKKTRKEKELICVRCIKGKLRIRYKDKNLTCNIPNEDLLKLLKQDCHYCGSKPNNCYHYENKYYNYDFYYNGLDRIDSSKGYILNNVVPCCIKCNIAKSDMEYQEFINHIKRVYNHLCLQ